MKTRSQPKGARQENAFSSRQTVHVFLGRPITQDQAVPHQLALNRRDRSADPFVRGRQKAEQGQSKQTRIERVRAIRLSERLLVDVVTPLANLVVDLFANLSPALDVLRLRVHATFGDLNRAIERDP